MTALQGASRLLFDDFRQLGFTVAEATAAATDERVLQESVGIKSGIAFLRFSEREGRAKLAALGRAVAPKQPAAVTEARRADAEYEVAAASAFSRKPQAWAVEALRADALGGRRALLESRGAAVATVREAGAVTTASGRMRVKIIAPGRGSCGYYGAEMLKRDGPKVFTAGLQSFLDHPTESERYERPERSVRDLAGRLASAAVWEDSGPLGSGLYADIEVFPQFQELLQSVARSIGVSIRAYGDTKKETGPDGVYGPTITELIGAESIDFVTAAGAGGAIVTAWR
jgi:hypothetical protein